MNGTIQDTTQDSIQVENREATILNYCKVPRTREEIQKYSGIRNRAYFRKYVLKPLLDSNKLSMTIPNKPNSRMQKYVKIKK